MILQLTQDTTQMIQEKPLVVMEVHQMIIMVIVTVEIQLQKQILT